MHPKKILTIMIGLTLLYQLLEIGHIVSNLYQYGLPERGSDVNFNVGVSLSLRLISIITTAAVLANLMRSNQNHGPVLHFFRANDSDDDERNGRSLESGLRPTAQTQEPQESGKKLT